MPAEIRFHLDESVSNAVARGLRQRGIDVTVSKDVGLVSAGDDEQLAFALSAGRVVITHDDDFLRWHARGIPHAGIAYSHLQKRSIGELVRKLVQLWRIRSAEEMEGTVEFL